MTIETITDYIALYGPSVAQVVSLIAALVFFIKNIIYCINSCFSTCKMEKTVLN